MTTSTAAALSPLGDLLPSELPYARCYWYHLPQATTSTTIHSLTLTIHHRCYSLQPCDCACTACLLDSEENVWWLCRRLLQRGDVHAAHCLFISNPDRRVLMLRQRAGSNKRDGLVVWDYHVIAVAAVAGCCYVLDVDSSLPFPCPLGSYMEASFPSVATHLRPLFRLIPAAAYITHFASDRSHMRREDGSWHVQPPSWPSIQPADQSASNNIQAYITMAQLQARLVNGHTQQFREEELAEEQYGRVLTMQQLIDKLNGQQQQTVAIDRIS